MKWTMERLESVVRDGAKPSDARHQPALRGAETALSLLNAAHLGDVDGAQPTPPDLAAVAAEGYPWRSLVPVTRRLMQIERPEVLAELALEVVRPYDDLSGRLFHLAILGEVLHALRTAGARVKSRHPLGDGYPGPAYRVIDVQDREWDLWFEAAGAWTHYGVAEPYLLAANGVPGAGAPLGTDLMLIRARECALLLECKHSSNPSVVARDGYLQALAYATEALELAPEVTSVVVGPEGVVEHSGWAETTPGLVGIISPEDVPPLIEHALSRD